VSTDEFALYDAAYVLGALSPSDRREFEDHLNGCAACASSVGELAGLPDLMSKVSLEQLSAGVESPPETLLPALARAVRRERVRRRLGAGAAAAAAACLIAVGAVALTGPDSPARQSVAPTASRTSTRGGTANLALSVVVASPVTASARLVDMGWGTRLDVTSAYDAKGLPTVEGLPIALVVIDREGVCHQVATWNALPDRELTVLGASSLARKDIAAVEVRTLSGRALLRLQT
jgi:anti-sigma factor RsiW